MVLFYTCILLVLAKKIVNCQEVKNPVVFCNEKFTERTNRDYTNYRGCWVDKTKPHTVLG